MGKEAEEMSTQDSFSTKTPWMPAVGWLPQDVLEAGVDWSPLTIGTAEEEGMEETTQPNTRKFPRFHKKRW